ncbi:hypothetical protein BIW11_10521, partial [Tropilaelaps mercedesae]
ERTGRRRCIFVRCSRLLTSRNLHSGSGVIVSSSVEDADDRYSRCGGCGCPCQGVGHWRLSTVAGPTASLSFGRFHRRWGRIRGVVRRPRGGYLRRRPRSCGDSAAPGRIVRGGRSRPCAKGRRHISAIRDTRVPSSCRFIQPHHCPCHSFGAPSGSIAQSRCPVRSYPGSRKTRLRFLLDGKRNTCAMFDCSTEFQLGPDQSVGFHGRTGNLRTGIDDDKITSEIQTCECQSGRSWQSVICLRFLWLDPCTLE